MLCRVHISQCFVYNIFFGGTCGTEILPSALGHKDEDGDDDHNDQDDASNGDADGEAPLWNTEPVRVILPLKKSNVQLYKRSSVKHRTCPGHTPAENIEILKAVKNLWSKNISVPDKNICISTQKT